MEHAVKTYHCTVLYNKKINMFFPRQIIKVLISKIRTEGKAIIDVSSSSRLVQMNTDAPRKDSTSQPPSAIFTETVEERLSNRAVNWFGVKSNLNLNQIELTGLIRFKNSVRFSSYRFGREYNLIRFSI